MDICPWLDDENVVFGKVTSGKILLNIIKMFGSKSGEVNKLVEITDCGEADWTEAEDKSKGPSRSAQSPQEAIVKSN